MIKHLAIPALMVAALCLTTTPAWSDKGHKGKDEKCDVADLEIGRASCRERVSSPV